MKLVTTIIAVGVRLGWVNKVFGSGRRKELLGYIVDAYNRTLALKNDKPEKMVKRIRVLLALKRWPLKLM